MTEYFLIGVFFAVVSLVWVGTVMLAFHMGVKASRGETITVGPERDMKVYEPGDDEPEQVDEYEVTWPLE